MNKIIILIKEYYKRLSATIEEIQYSIKQKYSLFSVYWSISFSIFLVFVLVVSAAEAPISEGMFTKGSFLSPWLSSFLLSASIKTYGYNKGKAQAYCPTVRLVVTLMLLLLLVLLLLLCCRRETPTCCSHSPSSSA